MKLKSLIETINLCIVSLSRFVEKETSRERKSGHLYIKKEKGHLRFYHRESPSKSCSKYLSKSDKSDMELLSSLAQQEYSEGMVEETYKNIEALNKCLEILENCTDPDDVYDELPEVRKNLVSRISTSIVDIEKWKDRGDFRKLGFDWNDKYIVAKNGLRVRSKTEEIIVNIFEELGIPYIYELLMEIEDEWIYPDFHVLNVRTGKEYIYEHCGKMDDSGYVERNLLRKLELYAKKDIFLGDNLLITFETNSHPLNEQYLRQFIKKYFL